MRIIYLKSMDSWQEVAENRIIYLFKRLFYIPKINKIYSDKQEYILPYVAEDSKNIIRFLRRIRKVEGIVLDKELIKNKELCKKIEEKNIYLFNGKWLFRYFIIETIEYICEKKKVDMDTLSIALLIKDTSDESIQTILKIVDKVKNISIITTEINKFRKIEKNLYEEMGIPIKISNNKKKSLKNESIIVNVDFTEKELNSYNIYQEAIIINIKNNINSINKSFHGININNFEIQKTKYDIKGFESKCIYETNIYKKDTFDNIKTKLETDKITIKYLIGQRGKIEEREYKNFIKTIDKNANLT